jgi:hypothetical protein
MLVKCGTHIQCTWSRVSDRKTLQKLCGKEILFLECLQLQYQKQALDGGRICIQVLVKLYTDVLN